MGLGHSIDNSLYLRTLNVGLRRIFDSLLLQWRTMPLRKAAIPSAVMEDSDAVRNAVPSAAVGDTTAAEDRSGCRSNRSRHTQTSLAKSPFYRSSIRSVNSIIRYPVSLILFPRLLKTAIIIFPLFQMTSSFIISKP